MLVPEPKKLPSGNYNIMLRLGGENISITRSTDRECILEAQVIKSEYLIGRRKKQANMTIKEALDKYVSSRKNVLSASTINGYNSIIRNRFKNYINKKPSDIKDWQTVINDEVLSGISAKTINNSWDLLCSAFKYNNIPVPEVTLPQVVQSQRPYLSTSQVKTFISAIKGHPCEIPALLALHSLRRSEILGLTWDKIDLENKTIRIEGSAVVGDGNKLVYKKTNKTKKSRRTIPIMIPALETALKAVPEEKRTGLVYGKTPNLIWEQVNYICAKNNLPKVGVHGLRHSFATVAFSSDVGLTEREVMEIGGWECQQVVHGIYEHLSQENRLKAENKFAQFFKNADKNADGTSTI